jgi:hypothetical protein
LEPGEDFALGVRATSVNGGGSIKFADTDPVYDDKDDSTGQGGDFPEWEQDVSNIILVFDQTEGDVKPKPEVDGYYTVKIDGWDGSNDLDDDIGAILAYLVEKDPNIDADSDLLGVIIKGGTQDTNFYAYGDNNTNGTAPYDKPEGLALSWTGSSNPAPANAVDESYNYYDEFGVAII